MRRYEPPFNGKRFVLNRNTGEIHDLDAEVPQCRINEILPEHICSCDSYIEAEIFAYIDDYPPCPHPNGCHYCNCSSDNG